VEELLAPEPAERLGMGARGYAEMRRHVWFDGFDWSALRNGTMAAPREPGSQNSTNPEKPKAKTAAATKSAASKAMLDALAQLQQRTGRDGRMVAFLFIELPDKAMYPDYYKIIRNPVCFSTIQQRVETSWYKDWPNFEKDVLLIFANARQYNLPGSQVCLDADALEKAYRALVAKMHTTTKKSTTRPVPDKKPKQPQRKQARLKAMLGAWSVLSSCTANDGRQLAKHFLRLPSKKTYADYYKIVKVPICLHMIKEKIKRAHYRSWAAFENDVLRMLRNARKYNLPGSQIFLDTDALERAYRTYVAKVAKELKGAAQPIAKKKKQQVRSAGKQTASEAMLGAWQALAMLIGDDGRWLAGAFMELPDQLLYAEYFDKIKVPMCLNSIKEKVEGDSYAGWRAFEKDVLRVFDNARQFNDRSSQIAQDADIMVASFREYGKSLPSDVKTAKISAKRKKSSLSSKQSPTEAMQGALTALDALVADDERWLAGAFTDLPDRLFYPEYFDQIKAPMCLSRIKEKVGCGAYAGWRSFEKDMLLIFDNARRFNDRGSQIAQDADTMEASFREYGKSLPSDVKTAKIVNRSKSMGSPEKIAKFKVWQQLCSQTGAKGRYLAKAFRELPDQAMYPNYFDIIRQPMCLSIIKEKLDQSSYKDWAAFEKDILLIFANARQYNLPGSQVCLDADALEKAYHGYSVRDQRPSSALHDCEERSTESSGYRMQAAWAHLCGYTSVDGRYLAKAFRELPDQAMYPNYFDIIRQPMCLSVIKEKLDQSSYKDWAAFEKDILLIFANARQYNLPGSQVCLDADALEKAYRGSRASGPSASAIRSTSDVPAIDAHVKIRMQEIWQAVVDCEDTSGRTRSTLFMVKPSAIDYPDYYTIIERAIDLTTIRERIESDAYATRLEFVSDMRLLFDNAQLYNMASSQVAIDAVALWELVEDWDCGREDDGTGRRRLRKRRRGQ
jgi:protein polybromo-1